MPNIFKQILTKLKENQRVYLLTVIQNSGSSPGRKGFKMMVAEDGFISGSIGGGVMEYKLVEATKKLFRKEKLPILFKKQIHQGKAKDSSGMICSGEQTVVFHPLSVNNIRVVEQIITSLSIKSQGILELSNKGINFLSKETTTSITCKIESELDWQYNEQLNFKEPIYIIGAGHVGLAVSKLLNSLNFYVEIFDDRTNLNTLNQNCFVDKKEIIDFNKIDNYVVKNAFVLIMTTKFTSDKLVLTKLLKSEKVYKYLGVLGSKSKIETLFEMLISEGFTKEELQKVHAPIGLQINSQTPEEIAISIAAQIIQIKNKS